MSQFASGKRVFCVFSRDFVCGHRTPPQPIFKSHAHWCKHGKGGKGEGGEFFSDFRLFLSFYDPPNNVRQLYGWLGGKIIKRRGGGGGFKGKVRAEGFFFRDLQIEIPSKLPGFLAARCILSLIS